MCPTSESFVGLDERSDDLVELKCCVSRIQLFLSRKELVERGLPLEGICTCQIAYARSSRARKWESEPLRTRSNPTIGLSSRGQSFATTKPEAQPCQVVCREEWLTNDAHQNADARQCRGGKTPSIKCLTANLGGTPVVQLAASTTGYHRIGITGSIFRGTANRGDLRVERLKKLKSIAVGASANTNSVERFFHARTKRETVKRGPSLSTDTPSAFPNQVSLQLICLP